MATAKENQGTEVITFKADRDLMKLLKGIRNRSEFIRTAILGALDNVCPVCHGSGVLTPHSKQHWNDLARHHNVKECKDCHEDILVCAH
jgi:hypothetical protein